MIKAELQGRRLVLTVETSDDETPIAPFVIEPLNGKTGRTLAIGYGLLLIGQAPDDFVLSEALVTAAGQVTFDRLDEELRQEEAEQILMAAFYWQTAIGMDGVNAILEGGVQGVGKASALFAQRMAPLLPRTQPSLGSENPTNTDDTADTGTPSGGAKPGKQPRDKLPPKQRAPKPAKAPDDTAPSTQSS